MSVPGAPGQHNSLKQAAIIISRLEERLAALEQAPTQPIAIVGLGCRFPGGADSPEALWALLDAGRDAVSSLEQRWALLGSSPSAAVPRWAGLLHGAVDQFDAAFFGISPREARSLDPQHRLLLELAWEALEHAGIAPRSLSQSRTGVFIGACSTDYRDAVASAPRTEQDAYSTIGNLLSVAAGRLSYTLGLQGPCLTVDTACSSSLVAVHLACRSLRSRESNLALAAGINLILSAETMESFARTQVLSPDGRCKTFDAAANGMVRGEGCGLVVLKRLADAQRDGDRIWALIRGSAVNQDGRSTGLTAPNVLSQQELLREALKDAQVAADAVDYVETHGTGTPLGDPIEVAALAAVVGRLRTDQSRCVLGAVKTNLGHLEGAAGVAGLIKATLALAHQRIPKNLHFRTLNAHIELAGTSLALATEPVPWPRGERPRFAGVSSFGLSGTNAHVVLQEAPDFPLRAALPSRAAELLVLSAKSPAALRSQAAQLLGHLRAHPELTLRDVAYSLATTRSEFAHRLAIAATSPGCLTTALERAAAGETAEWTVHGATRFEPGKLVFLFPGQGAQRLGMGRELYASWSAFGEALDRCAGLFDKELPRPLKEVMWAAPGSAAAALLEQTQYTQPALFALGFALAALWRSWGVTPDLLCGHSLGELVAACVAGVFSVEDGVRLCAARGRLMQALPANGAMVSISATEAEVAKEVMAAPAQVAIAAVNASEQVVLGGEKAAVLRIAAEFAGRGRSTRLLAVSQAFHSPLIEPMLEPLRQVAERIHYQRPTVPLLSNLTGQLGGDEVGTADYWVRHARQTVRFAAGIKTLQAAGADTWIELGPQAMLLNLGDLPETAAVRLPALRGERDEPASALAALGGYWVHGGSVDWKAILPGGRRLQLPTYPWQRQRYWTGAPRRPAPASTPPLAAATPELASCFYQTRWVERPAGVAEPPAPVRRWLVFADRSGLGAAVAAVLGGRGLDCTVVPHDSADEPARWLPVPGAPPWGIIHLRSLDCPDNDALDICSATAASQRVCAELLRLLPQLAACGQPPQLWLLTRGAQSTRGESASVAQAPLWGLGRVLALEHPNLWGGLIDLDPAAPSDEAARLCQAVLGSDGEDHLALRGGSLFAARLVRSKPAAPAEAGPQVHADKVYLITGGLGGLGLATASWLVQRGARRLLLTGRSELPERPRWGDPHAELIRRRIQAVQELEAQGATVQLAAVELTDPQAVRRLLQGLASPIGGIIHAAGIGPVTPLLASQSVQTLAACFAAKVLGTWVLHTVSQDLQLDFFVMFSSAAATWGGKGQGHYAAANHFLDALAHARRAQQQPALSLALGPVAGGGMTAAAPLQFSDLGLQTLPTTGLGEALALALGAGGGQFTVAAVDWARFKPLYEFHRRMPLFESLAAESSAHSFSASPPTDLRAVLRTQPDRAARLRLHINDQLAQVLQLDPAQLALQTPFSSLGVDSLMSVELRDRLHASLGVKLPATVLFTQPNPAALVAQVLELLDQPGDLARIPASQSSPSLRSHPASDAPAPAAAVATGEPSPPQDRGAPSLLRRSPDGWIVTFRPAAAARIRLIGFPYAGGGATVFQHWPSHLGPEIEVCAVQLPGRQERLHEPVPASIAQLVDRLLPALIPYLDLPFVFFGHCLGAILAYEVMCRLRERRLNLPLLLFVSGAQSPQRYLMPNAALQSVESLVETLRFIGFAAPAVLADRAELSSLLAPVRADMSLAAQYSAAETVPFAMPITSFSGQDDVFAAPQHVDWSQETTGGHQKHIYPGDHYFVDSQRAAILQEIQLEVLGQLARQEERKMRDTAAARWLQLPCPRPTARRRLFCFPPAGGAASIFSSWAAALPADVELVAIELPGRGARAAAVPLCRVSDMVEAILGALAEYADKPFAMFGHDLGALLLFEVTRSLQRSCRPLPQHLFVSAAMAPKDSYFPPLHLASTARMLSALRALALLPPELPVPERTWQGDCAAMATYVYQPQRALAVPITAFLGETDAAVSARSMQHWQHETTGEFVLHLIPGDHQIVRHSAAVLLGRICSSSHFLTDPIHDNIAPRAEPEVSLRAEAKCLQRSGFGSAALHEE